MMKVLFSAVALIGAITVCSSAVPAQQERGLIRIAADRALDTQPLTYPVVEPHLSSHPTDPNVLFVVAMVAKSSGAPSFDCVTYASTDGARSWRRKELGIAICGNPWSVVTADGAMLFTALTERRDPSRFQAELRTYRSGDSGRSFSEQHYFGPGFDYPKIVQDSPRGRIYVVGGRAVGTEHGLASPALVSWSIDGGRTFPDSIYLATTEHISEAQVPVVLSDGTLVIPRTEHTDQRFKRLPAERSWISISRDGGRTFGRARLIAEGCNQQAGWAYLAADRSDGKYRDRLYWMCPRTGVNGIWIMSSDDVGQTWSDWTRIDDGPAAARALLPNIAVNRSGVLAVSWLSRTEGTEPCNRLVVSASLDGGRTFLKSQPASSAPSCPARDPRNAPAYQHRPLGGGDYNGLAASSDGSFHAVWADARTGVYQLRHARIEVAKN